MDTPRPDTASASSSTVSEATTSPNTSTGITPSTQSFWHDCKTPEPLPQAPPVLPNFTAAYGPIAEQGHGFHEPDVEMNEPVVLKATKAEVRTLAQHHLDRTFFFSVWFSTGNVSSSEMYCQAYHENRFYDLLVLLDAKDHRHFDEIIRIRNEYIRTLTAEQEARDAWEAQLEARGGWGPEIDAREEWEANQDPRD
jgi:hypothetical protein